MEFKQLALTKAQIKMAGDGYVFEGYASMFGGLDAYKDSVVPGAYAKTIKNRERPIRMRWNHFGPIIGKWLDIKEDDHGLWVKGELTPGHSVAENAYASLKHGAVDSLSIGYIATDTSEEGGVRYLKEIDLREISVVEEPADLGAKIGEVKHLKEMVFATESIKEVEAILREAGGFSRVGASAIVTRIKQLYLGERDRKDDDEWDALLKGILEL